MTSSTGTNFNSGVFGRLKSLRRVSTRSKKFCENFVSTRELLPKRWNCRDKNDIHSITIRSERILYRWKDNFVTFLFVARARDLNVHLNTRCQIWRFHWYLQHANFALKIIKLVWCAELLVCTLPRVDVLCSRSERGATNGFLTIYNTLWMATRSSIVIRHRLCIG